MVFPVLSSIACLLVVASFALPFIFIPELGKAFFDQQNHEQAALNSRIISYVLGFCFYVANYFVIVFFNVALVSCALIRFRGGNPTVGDGISAAIQRLPQIFAWAVVAATVGMILRMLEERLSWLGKIVVGLIGIVWSMAIYFVVPVLAAEQVGPIEAVKRSSRILIKTWGESLVGNVSIRIITLLFCLPAIALIIGGLVVGGLLNSMVLAIVIAAVGVLYLIFVSIVASTLQQIFLAGTYLYAAEGVVAPGFREELFRDAFRRK
jgi:hypothetical protein